MTCEQPHSGMTHYGQLLRSFRSQRNLTQESLATLSQLSRATIASAETSAKCHLSGSSALLLIHGLNASGKPLTPDQTRALGEPAGIDRIVLNDVIARQQEREPSNIEILVQALRDAPRSHGPLDGVISQLVRIVGEEGATEMLRSIVHALERREPSKPAPSDAPKAMRVAHPPVQREGYVEQQFTDYEVPAASPADPPPAVSRKRKAE